MENKHTAAGLAQLQSLPLEAKITLSKKRIKEWYDYWDGEVYVSFSGGKDSTVLKHLVENTVGVYDVPSVFVDTGLEYPEIRKFAMSQPNVITVRPAMRFDEVVKKYGYPVISKQVCNTVRGAKNSLKKGQHSLRLRQLGIKAEEYGLICDSQHDYEKVVQRSMFAKPKWRFLLDADFYVSEQCCDVMKKRPTKAYEKETGKKPFVGTLACESLLRKRQWLKSGCNAFENGRPNSQPMSFWTEQDVLHYIKKFDLPYCSVYGEIQIKRNDGLTGQIDLIDYLGCYAPEDQLETTGCDRTGCMFCMFGCHLEKEPNRFQRLKETHPKQWQYCIGGGEFVDGIWQPNKQGLGLGYVLDYIGVKYE